MGLGSVTLLKFFDWTTPEATKPLWKLPKKPVDPPKNGGKMLTLSFKEIQPNRFIQIDDDFNPKNFWCYTQTQKDKQFLRYSRLKFQPNTT